MIDFLLVYIWCLVFFQRCLLFLVHSTISVIVSLKGRTVYPSSLLALSCFKSALEKRISKDSLVKIGMRLKVYTKEIRKMLLHNREILGKRDKNTFYLKFRLWFSFFLECLLNVQKEYNVLLSYLFYQQEEFHLLHLSHLQNYKILTYP